MLAERYQIPNVGVGVMVMRGGRVLVCRRKGSHGAGEYSWPGGHLEYMETFENCARRECREEAGIEIENIRFQFLANVRAYAPKHYVHVGLIADWRSGEPQQREPDRGDEWFWSTIEEFPKPLFRMCELTIDALKAGKNYYDGV